jgi:hypothetical protein
MNDLDRTKQIIADSTQFTPAIIEKLQDAGFEKTAFVYKKKRMKPGNFWVSRWDSGYSFVIVINEGEGLKKDPCDVGYIVEGNIFSTGERKTVTYSLPEATRAKLAGLKWRVGKNMSDLVVEAVEDLAKLHESGQLNVEYAQVYSMSGKVSYSLSLGAFNQLRKMKLETKLNYVDMLVKAVDDLYAKYIEV